MLFLTIAFLAACTKQNHTALPPQSTDTRILDLAQHDNSGGFASAHDALSFQFPQDHGAHLHYKHERWQFNGNLHTNGGRTFAYQLTLRRLGLISNIANLLNSNKNKARKTQWRTDDIYMATLSVSDPGNEKFYQFEKTERANLGLADVSLNTQKHGESHLSMNIDDWTVSSNAKSVFPLHLVLSQNGIELDLEVNANRTVHSNGIKGRRQIGDDPDNAFYTYSFTRLHTSGRITVGRLRFAVEGNSWFDHDWGSATLTPESQDRDRFSLQLSDGRDLVYERVRDAQGNNVWSRGILVSANDQSEDIQPADMQLRVLQQWTSPVSGITYPLSWKLQLPKDNLTLTITPLMSNQEIHLAKNRWEGAVTVADADNTDDAGLAGVTGVGYLQLEGFH